MVCDHDLDLATEKYFAIINMGEAPRFGTFTRRHTMGAGGVVTLDL